MTQPTTIINGSEVHAPMAAVSSLRFELLSADGLPVEPQRIWGTQLYRTGRGYRADSLQQSSVNQQPNTELVFDRRSVDPAGRQPIWESGMQGEATATVAGQQAVMSISSPHMGELHDFSSDVWLADSQELAIGNDRLTYVLDPDNYNLWQLTVDCRRLLPDNTTLTLVYHRRPLVYGVRRIGPGTFAVGFDGQDIRLLPGRHVAVLDYETGGSLASASIEFHVSAENIALQPSSRNARAALQQMLPFRIPWFLLDDEGGMNKPSGQLFSYMNDALAEYAASADVMSASWDADICPTLFLRFIAWEQGSQLYGRDPGLWRKQVTNMPYRLKAKGTEQGLRDRLADCGVDLERLATYYQLRSQVFRTDGWILSPLSTFVPNPDVPQVGTWRLPLSGTPWFWPDGQYVANRLHPLTMLETRGPGEPGWRSVALASADGLPIVTFEPQGDGGWVAVINPWTVDTSTMTPTYTPIDPHFTPADFDQLRLTYPSAPWGVVPYEKTFGPEVYGPEYHRAGNYGVLDEANSRQRYVVLEARGSLISGKVMAIDVLQGTIDELPAADNLTPQARRGACCMFYGPRSMVMIGGVAADGTWFDECWTMEIADAGVQWTRYAGRRPSARSGMACVAPRTDAGDPRYFIHGGVGEGGMLDDTWEWYDTGDGWGWRQMTYEPVVASAASHPFSLAYSHTGAHPEILQGVTYEFPVNTLYWSGFSMPECGGRRVVLWCESYEKKESARWIATIMATSTPSSIVLRIDQVLDQPTPPSYDFRLYIEPAVGDSFTCSLAILVSPAFYFTPGQEAVLRRTLYGELQADGPFARVAIEAPGSASLVTFSVLEADGRGTYFGLDMLYEFMVARTPGARAGAASRTMHTQLAGNAALGFAFGGQLADGSYGNDLWVFSADEGWYQVRTSNDIYRRSSAALAAFADFDPGYSMPHDCRLLVSGGHLGPLQLADPTVQFDPLSVVSELRGLSGAESTALHVVQHTDLYWITPSGHQEEGWPLLTLANSSQQYGQERVVAPLHHEARRTSMVYRLEQGIDAAVTYVNISGVPTPPNTDFDEPLCMLRRMHRTAPASVFGRRLFAGGMLIESEFTGVSSYEILSKTPELTPYAIAGRPGACWSIIPRTRRVTNTLYPALTAGLPSTPSDPIAVRFYVQLDRHAVLEPTDEERSSLSIDPQRQPVAIARIIAAGAITQGGGQPFDILRAVVYADGSVTPNGCGLSWDGNDYLLFEQSNVLPCTMEITQADAQRMLLPPTGSWVPVADGWYCLATGDEYDPAMVVEDAETGSSFVMESGSFVWAYNTQTADVDCWVLAEEQPSIAPGSLLRLTARFPRIAPSNPWPVALAARKFVIPSNELIDSWVLTEDFGMTDWLPDEPAASWSPIDWQPPNIDQQTWQAIGTQTAVSLGWPEMWTVSVVQPNGQVLGIPRSALILRRTINLVEFRTSISLSIDTLQFPYPTPGSQVVVHYPTASGLRVCTQNQDDPISAVYGMADFEGRMAACNMGPVPSASRHPWMLDPAAAYAAGCALTVYPGIVRCRQFVVDYDTAADTQRPLRDGLAYDGFRDPNWSVRWTGFARSLWDSGCAVSGWWSSDGEIGEAGFGDDDSPPPTYSTIRALALAAPPSTAATSGGSMVVSLTYPVPTIAHELGITELFRVVTGQHAMPERCDSVLGMRDWLELYILSLPHADTRLAEDLETYGIWRQQVAAGNTPTIDPCPPIDHETRLAERDDPMLPAVCQDLTPFPGDVVFGYVRTRAPYGLTVFGREEYDGGTHPSRLPCDIDLTFREPCACCPASAIGYAVTIPLHLAISPSDVEDLVTSWMPANAVIRFSSLRFAYEEFMRRPQETLEWYGDKTLEEAVLCRDPRRMPDGSRAALARWTSWTRNSFVPLIDRQQTATTYGADWRWMLQSPELQRDVQPFGRRAFAVVGDIGTLLEGTDRLGDGCMLFTEAPGHSMPPGDPVEAGCSVYNDVPDPGTASVSQEAARIWLNFGSLDLAACGVCVGDIVGLGSGPESVVAVTELPSWQFTWILAIESDERGTWMQVTTTNPDSRVFDPLHGGPKCVMFFHGGVLGATPPRSTMRIINPLYKSDGNSRVPQARLERIERHQQDYFGLEASAFSHFVLPRGPLRDCYVLCQDDLDYFGSELIVANPGTLIDFIGEIRTADNQRLVTFYSQSGVLHYHNYVPIIGLTYDEEDRKLTAQWPVGDERNNTMLQQMHYTSYKEPVDAAYARATGCLMPRSLDPEFDYDPTRYLFWQWDDATSGMEWRPQTAFDWEIRSTWRVTLPEDSPVMEGDTLFLEQLGWLDPQTIDHYDHDTQTAIFSRRLHTPPTPPIASQDFRIGRRILQTSASNPQRFTRVVLSVLIDADLAAVSGWSWSELPERLILEVGGRPWKTTAVSADGSGNSLCELDTPLELGLLPAECRVTIFDMQDLNRRMPMGGSYIELHVIDGQGRPVETQRFN